MKPKRIRLSRAKGWRMPADTVNVARPGPWGNPFIIGEDVKTAAEAVESFRYLCGGLVDLGVNRSCVFRQRRFLNHANRHLDKLRGKDLACWCRDKPCHADVLLELLEKTK